MRISDWSSDVCSSDLGNWVDPALVRQGELLMQADELARRTQKTVIIATMNGLKVQHIYLNRSQDDLTTSAPSHIGMHCSLATTEIGRASCRERVGQNV